MNISNISPYKNHLDFKVREQNQSENYRGIDKVKDTNIQNEQYFSGRRYNIGKDTVIISKEGLDALTKMRENKDIKTRNVSSKNTEGAVTIEQLQKRVREQREAQLDMIAKEQGLNVNELKNKIKEADPEKLKLIPQQLNLGIEQLMQFKGNNLWL